MGIPNVQARSDVICAQFELRHVAWLQAQTCQRVTWGCLDLAGSVVYCFSGGADSGELAIAELPQVEM